MSKLTIAQIQSIINDRTRELGRVIVTDETGANKLAVDATGAAKVTANAGTNLNTSALALETGGNLAAIKTNTDDLETALSSVVDAGNSSVVALGAGASFTGTGVDVLQYSAIVVNVITDVVSHVTGFKPQFSSDNTNWDDAMPGTGMYESPGAFRTYSVEPRARYFRMLYTNGAGAQAYMRLQTILFKHEVGSTVCLGESTLTKRGQLIFGISSGNTAVPPLCAIMGNVDSVATGYTGFLTNTYAFGYDPLLDKWHRVRVSSTSKCLRTLIFPDRPTSDLGAACVSLDHGTVTADWSSDTSGTVTQSASYNLWITDISIYNATDPTTEAAVQEIPLTMILTDVTDSQSRWFGGLSIPTNQHINFNTPILIPKGHQYNTVLKLGGATNLALMVVLNGYEEA